MVSFWNKNYSSWRATVVKFEGSDVSATQQQASLRFLDLEPADAEYVQEVSRDDEMADMSKSVSTLLHTVLANVSFEKEYDASFWQLTEKTRACASYAEEMLANYVNVVRVPDVAVAAVWQGSRKEEQMQRTAQPNRRAQAPPRGPRGSGGAAAWLNTQTQA